MHAEGGLSAAVEVEFIKTEEKVRLFEKKATKAEKAEAQARARDQPRVCGTAELRAGSRPRPP